MLKRLQFGLFIFALTAWSLCDSQSNPSPSPRVIELTADRAAAIAKATRPRPLLRYWLVSLSLYALPQCGRKKWRAMAVYTG